ncbi:MAG TPA: glycosyltransferase family 87 protein [Gaiellaceae bacterium]|nr:glycosyltransferase family 87 protein [Gaiellaceae bacterium]
MREASGSRAALLAAFVLLACSFVALQLWLERGQLSDVPVYEHDARLVRDGALPYRDFRFEYPPAALPVLLAPAVSGWSYASSFAALMGLCGAGCLAVVAWALRGLEAGRRRAWSALVLVAGSPLALGSLFDTRFDLWPALLACGAVAALVRERPLWTGSLLGLGFAAKLWPAVLLPLALAHLWRRRGPGAAAAAAGGFAAVAAACFLPFALLAPGGLRWMLADQLGRPLQVESLGAAVLMAAQRLGLRPLTTISTHGAQSLSGGGVALAGSLSTACEVAVVLAVWLTFARRRRDAEEVTAAAAAAVAALVAFDRVLSPQYLIWLVPLIALVGGRRGVAAAVLLLVALGLTQTWFPWHYWQLALAYASPWSWYLLARDLVLVALVAVLSSGGGSGAGRARWPAARRAAA